MYGYYGSDGKQVKDKNGNEFFVVKNWDGIMIQLRKVSSKEVFVPDLKEDYKKSSKFFLRFDFDGKNDVIQILHIPKNLNEIYWKRCFFPNLEKVTIDPGNKHLSTDGCMVFSNKGKTLERCLVCRGESVTVPEFVKRIKECAFYGTGFREINFPETKVEIEKDAFKNSKFERTSTACGICIENLKQLPDLWDIVFTEGQSAYKAVDGVLYSKDQKTLVFYPRGRQGESFRVPEGVERIAEGAFEEQRYLKEIIIPDSVNFIGRAAFYGCGELTSITLPENLTEFPDANFYDPKGVFGKCWRLQSIKLPKKLNYLGSYSFYESGLSEISINDTLEHIGPYALATERLVHISLPLSVKYLGEGALLFAKEVKAYEGTSRGLISAVNATNRKDPYVEKELKWKSCVITVLHQKDENTDSFMIPESLKGSAAWKLDAAWNGNTVDYAIYEECLTEILDSGERLAFAAGSLSRHPEDDNSPMLAYIRRVSFKIAMYFLKEKKIEEFLSFLKRDYLTKDSLQKLLNYCNENGFTICSAYILDYKNEKNKHGNSLRL